MDAADRRLAVSWSPVEGATGYKVAARLMNGVEPFAWMEYEAEKPPYVIVEWWAAMSGLEYEVRAASVSAEGQSEWSAPVAATAPELRPAPAGAVHVLNKGSIVGDLMEVNVLNQRPFTRRSQYVWSVCGSDGSGCELLPLVGRRSYLYFVPGAARGKSVRVQVDYDKDGVSYTAAAAVGAISDGPTAALPAECGEEEPPSGAGEFAAGEDIATHLYLLESKSVAIEWDPEIKGGGAIEPLCNDLLAVTPWGNIALARSNGSVERIEGRVPMNIEGLPPHPDSEEFRRTRLRVADILLRHRAEGRWELFVTHHHFTEVCVRFRLSSTMIHLEGGVPSVSPEWRTVFEAEPCLSIDSHYETRAGGRILPDGPDHLLVVIGDHGDLWMDGVPAPQHPDAHLGKLVRVAIESGEAETLATGLRNPQGFARDGDGALWATEHGPQGGDELNLLESGANYGWPYVSYGTRYAGYTSFTEKETLGTHEGFVKPRFTWVPSIAVSAVVVNDKRWLHLWGDDLLVGSLGRESNGRSLFRVRLDGTEVQYVERIPVGYRIRDLTQMPDGRLALLADGGRVHFISPSKEPCRDRSEERLRRELLVYAIGCGAAGGGPPDTETEGEPGSENGAGSGAITPASGAQLYAAHCAACHSLADEEHGIGPHLVGVIGRRVGGAEGWGFSDGLRSLGGVWTTESLARFLADPQGFAPGTTMDSDRLSESEASAIADYIGVLRGE